jgi:Tol biopolymer transport system component
MMNRAGSVAACLFGTLTLVVALGASVARAAFPGANGKITYLALSTDVSDPPAAHLQIWTVNVDGSAATQLTHDDTGNVDHPAFSPDGTKIAYEADGGHVFVMNANGTDPVDLTPGTHADQTYDSPSWSPDGTKLAVLYRDQGDATPEYDVAVISATTPSSSLTNLTAGAGVDSGDPGPGHAGGPVWSPDGTKIAFVRGNPWEIWVMNANGSNQHVITNVPDDANSPAWSPDGTKIVFDSDGVLYTTDPAASSPGQTALTGSLPQAATAADYSPDGAQIVEVEVPVSGTDAGETTIATLNANGAQTATALTDGPSVFGAHLVDEPSWQPASADHLTVATAGTGSGTVTSAPAGISCPGTCTFPYGPGATVTLTATAGSGAYFAGWSGGGCSGTSNTCKVTLSADTTVTATFNGGYLLTVKPSPDLGMEIHSVPAGIDCKKGSQGTCSATFAAGSSVTLSQNTLQDGALFTGWSGGGCAGIGSCTVKINSALTVTGAWTYIPPQPSGTTVDAPLAFTAPGSAGYVGTEWTGFLTAVDCVSSSLCVSAGYMTDSATIAHKGIISTNSTYALTGNWSAGVPDPDFNWAPPGDQWQLQDVSCAGTSFCGAVDDQGDVFTTTNPAKGADTFGPNPQGVWQKTPNLDPIGDYSYHQTEAIACPAAGECVVIDADGGLLSSTNTAGGASTWSRQDAPGQGSPTSVSCPGPSSCYIATATGDVLKSITSSASSTPAVRGPWTAMAVDPGNELDNLYCFQADCFATDLSGNLWFSTHPDDGAGAWAHVNLGNHLFTGISCTSTSFCVLVDNTGDAFISENPTGGSPGGWASASVAKSDGLDDVSCTSALVHLQGNEIWCIAIAYDGKFVEGSIPVLSISRQGSGSGSVSSSTAISCGTTCSTAVPAGTTVTLTATPSSTSAFSAWGPGCASTASAPLTCKITMTHPFTTQIDAIFSPPSVSTGGGITFGGGAGTTTILCKSKVACKGSATLLTSVGKIAEAGRSSHDSSSTKSKASKPSVIGSGRFRIKPRKRRKITIRLTPKGKKLVRHHKLHSVTLTVTTLLPHHKRLTVVRTLKVHY